MKAGGFDPFCFLWVIEDGKSGRDIVLLIGGKVHLEQS